MDDVADVTKAAEKIAAAGVGVDYSQEGRHVFGRKISENSCLGLCPV